MGFIGVIFVIVIIVLLIIGVVAVFRYAFGSKKTDNTVIKCIFKRLSELNWKYVQLEEKVKELQEKAGIKSEEKQVKEEEKKVEKIKPITPIEVPSFKAKTEVIGQKPGLKDLSIEEQVAGKWFLWVGIIAVLFGVGYFLKYAFERGWVSETIRVIIGLITGCGFLVMGKFTSKKYPAYSQGISGGGIAILYLSIFASFNYYHLIDQITAFIIMTLITLTGVLLSVYYNAISIAVLSLIGGFLTPILLDTGTNKQVELLSYIVLLDVGVLVLGYFKNWTVFKYLSFIGTLIIFSGWAASYYKTDKLIPTEIFLSIFFIIFSVQIFLQNVIHGSKSKRVEELLFILINGFIYYGLTYGIMTDKSFGDSYNFLLTIIAIVLSLIYYIQGRMVLISRKGDKYLIMILLGLAITFLTIAIVVLFEQFWITIGWAIESIILVFIGFKFKSKETRIAGLAVLVLVLIRLFFWDTWFNVSEYSPVLNKRLVAFIFGIASVFGSLYLYVKNKSVMDEIEKPLLDIIAVTGNFLLFWLISTEIFNYYDIIYSKLFSMNVCGYMKGVTLSAAWSIYSICFLLVGFIIKHYITRITGLCVLLFVVIRLVFVDTWMPASVYSFIFNPRTLSFILCIAGVFTALYLYSKYHEDLHENEKPFVNIFAVTSSILIVWLLTSEVVGYYDKLIGLATQGQRELRQAKDMMISVTWTVFSIILMIYGIFKRYNVIRLLAIMIFAITIIKVFFVDLAFLETIYRIISFMVLGAILILTAFLYGKFKDKIIQFTIKE